MSEHISREDELRAKFKGQAYHLGETRRRNERVGSWDSLRDHNDAARAVDHILDEYNQLRFGQEIEVIEVPDCIPANIEMGEN